MSAVNLAETIGLFARHGAVAQDIHEMIDGFRVEVVPFDTDLAYETGLLVPTTRAAGLSLGDRACLALAIRRRAPAVTADQAWSRIADAIGVEVEVIR